MYLLTFSFQDGYSRPSVGARVSVLSRRLQVRRAELHLVSDFKVKRRRFQQKKCISLIWSGAKT